MSKQICIGVLSDKPAYKTISITSNNINNYFDIVNDTYYFELNDSIFTSNNKGVDNSVARTTLTAKQDLSTFSFGYSVSSESNFDKLTITIGGTVIVNGFSGVNSGNYNGSILKDLSIIVEYSKDVSVGNNDDNASIFNLTTEIYIDKVGEVAQKVNKVYFGDKSNTADLFTKGYIGVNGVARLFYEIILPSYAMLYSDGSMDFLRGTKINSNKTLMASYNVNKSYFNYQSLPWYNNINSIKTVNFKKDINITSLANYMYNASNLISVNYGNLNMDNITDMCRTYYRCHNLTSNPVCGDKVTNMHSTYENCYNLTGQPVCGNKVTDMYSTYDRCYNLTGNPVCGPNVINMASAYYLCNNLTGSPVCGNNVIDMSWAYYNCYNLTGSPVCGNNVTSMQGTYYYCYNLTGSPVCGNNVIDITYAYSHCRNLTGNPVCGNNVIYMANTYSYCNNLTSSPVCGDNVTDMSSTYEGCTNLTGSPVCGNNAINMAYTYYDCYNLTGSPVCGNNVTNMFQTYHSCSNLTGNPVCSNNVIDMGWAYYDCYNLTGSPVCGNNVTSMFMTYYNCRNLTGNPVCGNNVINMGYAYYFCRNLTGSPICGDNVTNMSMTYYDCHNLTGNPICGDNVTDMNWTYCDCYNLTGNPICGNNVIDMGHTYFYCRNLTGNPICGDNVTSMSWTYGYCYNLIGNPICGKNVTNMYCTYYDCYNLSGNMYMYSNNVSNIQNCFYGKNNARQYNIYAHPNTTTWNTLSINNSSSLVGKTIAWTNDTATSGFYNTAYNIYVIPFTNITFTIDNTSYQTLIGTSWYNWCKDEGVNYGFTCDSNDSCITHSSGIVMVDNNPVIGSDIITDDLIATIVNMDFILQDFEYTANSDGTYTITAWKGTTNGVPGTKMLVPNLDIIIL